MLTICFIVFENDAAVLYSLTELTKSDLDGIQWKLNTSNAD